MDEYYKAAIGSKNQNYYLRIFNQFDKNGKVEPSWHWPAFFVTFFWFLYRKMWGNAFIYILLIFTLYYLEKELKLSGAASEVVPILAFFIVWVIPPAYANAFYYFHIREKIISVKKLTPDKQRQLTELSTNGIMRKFWHEFFSSR